MPIEQGQTLPGATLVTMGQDGPEQVQLADRLNGRKVVLFGLPGAFTGTCTTAHVPSFVRTADALREKGVDEIICVSVNDPFVLAAWGESTGATEAGITMLGDAESAFTKAIGMDFSSPARGMIDRSKRYAMVVEDGVVTTLQVEDNPGVCDASGGEAILATM
ncbi:peroxiredoxin [Tranquillimonas alkanivorans]|uniref:Glutathione-dependent peroxiredoxin n=1 Tax=Tranquillimonas alkanivorans TaxID=441119 RepID=A0A1I5PJ96_9RHOB|nr:peroxiredoxin [Tranquillimonas alkanivorans]SFP33616.1 thiol peroxidase (atypical 2-Cys peroxiredoxin) [Tranquillimonas alkanivorans]